VREILNSNGNPLCGINNAAAIDTKTVASEQKPYHQIPSRIFC